MSSKHHRLFAINAPEIVIQKLVCSATHAFADKKKKSGHYAIVFSRRKDANNYQPEILSWLKSYLLLRQGFLQSIVSPLHAAIGK